MCTLYERIIELCKERGITGSRVCLELGLSKSTLSDIKSGRKKSMHPDTIQKFATYFGVTVDYLLGNETEKAPAETGKRSNDSDILDEVDIAFYGDYKELTDENKETLRAMARLFRERQGKQE